MHPLINVVQPVVVEPIGLEKIIATALLIAGDDPVVNKNILAFEDMLHTIKNMETITPSERLAANILLFAVTNAINSCQG